MENNIDYLSVTSTVSRPTHEYFHNYDGSSLGLKEEIEKACEKIGLEVTESDINTIHKNLLKEGLYWFDNHNNNYISYCFEDLSL